MTGSSLEIKKSTNSDNQTNSATSKFKEHRPLAEIASCKARPEVSHSEPEIDHPNNQIATFEAKIGKLNKKMHTHIIITPPIGTEFRTS